MLIKESLGAFFDFAFWKAIGILISQSTKQKLVGESQEEASTEKSLCWGMGSKCNSKYINARYAHVLALSPAEQHSSLNPGAVAPLHINVPGHMTKSAFWIYVSKSIAPFASIPFDDLLKGAKQYSK